MEKQKSTSRCSSISNSTVGSTSNSGGSGYSSTNGSSGGSGISSSHISSRGSHGQRWRKK